MISLIQHHVHDDRTRPDVHRLGIRGLIEDFRSHVEKSSALGFDILVRVDLQLGRKSEIDYLDG